MTITPELSVIIPVLNERDALPELFTTLASQQDVDMELVFSDGGSDDGSREFIVARATDLPWAVTLVTGDRGRGRQLNAGATSCMGNNLLFLHADSIFPDTHAFRSGLDTLNAAISSTGSERVAGHFGLTFRRSSASPSLAYYYYESKARLDHRECIHGDQGMLLRRSFYNEIGPFDEQLSITEDTRFAEAIRARGHWLLLPATIHTSARRFETEGLRQRQILNAIIMNFAAIGWTSFFRHLPDIYRTQERSRFLDLYPMLTEIGRLIGRLPPRERLILWYDTGGYVSSHAWQIPFFLDTCRNFRRGLPPGAGNTPLLSCYDRYMEWLMPHPVVRACTSFFVWVWYQLTLLREAAHKGIDRP